MFVEVLRSCSLMVEKLNAKEVHNLSQFYESDSVIEAGEHVKFVGINEIERFWGALVVSFESAVRLVDVKLEEKEGGQVEVLAKLATVGQRSARVEISQSWAVTDAGWRMRGSKINAHAMFNGPEDVLMRFLKDFSVAMQAWLSGEDVSEENWIKIKQSFVAESQIILADGRNFSGARFVDLVAGMRGTMCKLFVDLSRVEILLMTDDIYVVSYLESRWADVPNLSDSRNTLAVVRNSADGWIWCQVQQTTIDPD
jgi:ketosteroid isomerase-like protein